MESSPGSNAAQELLPSLPPLPRATPIFSSITSPAPIAGVKRPAPTLLPPFEPLSSSPAGGGLLPRPLKRKALHPPSSAGRAHLKYPTPVPTSSTGILSSPPGLSLPRANRQPQTHRHGAGTVGLGSGVNSGRASTIYEDDATPGFDAPPPRPGLIRTVSSVSERAPLCDVPSVELSENGEALLMGRSSNSSHYRLSGDKLVSRVHVRARYVPASVPLEPNRVEVMCEGWNGLKLHCQGGTWELAKGDTFTSETEGSEIMLDVHGTRVLVRWPRRTGLNGHLETLANMSDSSWDDSPRVARRDVAGVESARRADAAAAAAAALHDNHPSSSRLQSSPLRRTARIESPESPTPAGNVDIDASSATIAALLPDHGRHHDESDDDEDGGGVLIYEDPDPAEEDEIARQLLGDGASGPSMETIADTSSPPRITTAAQDAGFSSDLSEPENDPDEENDPIIMSFGPFGANISSRFASFTASSPKSPATAARRRGLNGSPAGIAARAATREMQALKEIQSSGSGMVAVKEEPHEHDAPVAGAKQETPLPDDIDLGTITNHVVNQLAFSRLSSTPLSTILNNLPAEERKGISKDQLRRVVEQSACVGTIPRQGKDAAGKPLESEYYYLPEADDDLNRKAAVEGLRKPSLRNCRKQHKQYYWKRPKTP